MKGAWICSQVRWPRWQNEGVHGKASCRFGHATNERTQHTDGLFGWAILNVPRIFTSTARFVCSFVRLFVRSLFRYKLRTSPFVFSHTHMYFHRWFAAVAGLGTQNCERINCVFVYGSDWRIEKRNERTKMCFSSLVFRLQCKLSCPLRVASLAEQFFPSLYGVQLARRLCSNERWG